MVGGGYKLTFAFTGIVDFKSCTGQEYISGIIKACEDYDINFINMCEIEKYSFFDDTSFLPHYLKKFRFMKKPLIDGLVIWVSSLGKYFSQEQIVNKFNSLKPLPMVNVGQLDIPGIMTVKTNNVQAIRLVVGHLVRIHRYKTIAFMGVQDALPQASYFDAFKNVLREYNLDAEDAPIFMTRSLNEADIIRTVYNFFECYSLKKSDGENQIQAVVTSSDTIATLLISELEKRGVRIPDDVAVTGFNNEHLGITCLSPVTTVNPAYFEHGYRAVELLIDRIVDAEHETEVVTVPASLVIRESCGCFEDEIIQAGKKCDQNFSPENAHETEIREHIFSQVNQIFPRENYETKWSLVNGIFEDLYTHSEIPKTLIWFRRFLSSERNHHFDSGAYQQKITALRQCMLQLAGNDAMQREHFENVCNKLRVFCSTISRYESNAYRDISPRFYTIAQAAMQFATVSTGAQLKTALKANLDKWGISRIILSLSDNMTRDLETSSIELVLPELDEHEKQKLPYRINNEALFPKSFFPKSKRYSAVLAILHHNERYFGFAFMYMNSQNMEVYDGIRMLLCQSLYNLYLKEGRTKEHTMLLNTGRLENVLRTEDAVPSAKDNLTVQQIKSYLIEHINEMINLDKMAKSMGMSKNKLSRTTKLLTNCTVQSLHEKLKMDMAKNMILESHLKLTEIAEQLGFLNIHYFSNVFKKNFGKSPSNWAKDQKRKTEFPDAKY